MRAQIQCKLFLVSSTADRNRPESHVPCELNTKMPEATETLHRYQIAGAQTSIAKRVKRRNTGAKKWGGFRGSKLIGDRS
jgi:hypothetical protein